jgi:hypothetical protein
LPERALGELWIEQDGEPPRPPVSRKIVRRVDSRIPRSS